MRTYADLHAIAAARKGGTAALEALLRKPLAPEALAQIPEDRWLAVFSRTIFATGLNCHVVENKWNGIEDAFVHFS